MSHKIVVEPAPTRDSFYFGEEVKGFSPLWEQWFNSISKYSTGIEVYTETLNPTSVAANTTAEQTFTVTGIGVNDIILSVTKPSITAGIGIGNSRVSAANQIAITFINPTAGAIDPAQEDYKITVLRG